MLSDTQSPSASAKFNADCQSFPECSRICLLGDGPAWQRSGGTALEKGTIEPVMSGLFLPQAEEHRVKHGASHGQTGPGSQARALSAITSPGPV